MEKELQDFGLTDKETKVYLALLQLGTASVQEISKKAETFRTYTYEILNTLQSKGLVSNFIKSSKQYFEVAKPEKLLAILEEKESSIKRILPELKKLYIATESSAHVTSYQGKEGIKTILDDLITTKGESLAYGQTKMQLDLLKFNFLNYIQKRVEAKVHIKVLTEKSIEGKKMQKNDKKDLRETRFLPESMILPTTTYIWDDKVAILSLENGGFGVIIKNKEIAETQKMIFKELWRISSK